MAGGRTPLPDLSPDDRPFSRAHALSEDGSVAVGVSARDSQVPNTAVRWTDGGVEDLGALAVGALSWAWDVSGDGDTVVGWSRNENVEREAFRWTAGHGMQGLGDLPDGDHESEAYGVSADGWFVVGSGVTESGEEAFIWDLRRGMRRLQDVIEHALNTGLDGWKLTRATGITPDGGVIVGDGINSEGYTEAWRAVLPAIRTDVEIDLLPPRSRSRSGTLRGRLEVAVLGSEETNVSQVDLGSLVFGPDRAAPLHDMTHDIPGPLQLRSHLRDVNRDGQRDLVLHFRIADTGLSADDSQACLLGEIDRIRFTACDGVETLTSPRR
jgi:probable HAF family extracellular repeat protein